MAIDTSAISNVGEFYSDHYLDAILDKDVKSHFKAWEESEVRREWLGRLDGIVEGEGEMRKGTGLEFWFSLPELPIAHPSPHKMALVLLVVVFVLVLSINIILLTFVPHWPLAPMALDPLGDTCRRYWLY